jgi:hypothetical protein
MYPTEELNAQSRWEREFRNDVQDAYDADTRNHQWDAEDDDLTPEYEGQEW